MFTHPHRFFLHTYVTPTHCNYCQQVLWGIVKQGMGIDFLHAYDVGVILFLSLKVISVPIAATIATSSAVPWCLRSATSSPISTSRRKRNRTMYGTSLIDSFLLQRRSCRRTHGQRAWLHRRAYFIPVKRSRRTVRSTRGSST